MKKIQHIVITRFNLKISGGFASDKSGSKTRSEEWLDHRFELFERYCLPSMAAQSNKDFIWLVCFDEATDEKYRQRMQQARELCPQIQDCYIEGVDVLPELFRRVEQDADILITTRLDNDDAFREDALATVRQQVEHVNNDLCVNFRFGFAYNQTEAVVFPQKYNPFSSLIEFKKPEGFKTIFAAGHGKIHQLAKVRQIKTGPYWMMVVHDKNVTNKMPADFKNYNLWNPHKLKRYVKKYLLLKLRKFFWPKSFRRKYTPEEMRLMFHFRDEKKA